MHKKSNFGQKIENFQLLQRKILKNSNFEKSGSRRKNPDPASPKAGHKLSYFFIQNALKSTTRDRKLSYFLSYHGTTPKYDDNLRPA